MSLKLARPTWLFLAPGRFAASPAAGADLDETQWTKDFRVAAGELGPTGRNPWFVLEPGYRLVLAGGGERLTITVLDETREIDGVATRVVEERETNDGELAEAMDRAEVVGLHETVKTPGGDLPDCVKMEETTPLEPGEREFKYSAPGIGLVRDGALPLVEYRTVADSGGESR